MLQTMLSERERTRDRLEAARFLADRGWGKPVQAVDVDVAQREPLIDPGKLRNLTDAELDVMVTLMEKINLAE
jgi:hypothetical protein